MCVLNAGGDRFFEKLSKNFQKAKVKILPLREILVPVASTEGGTRAAGAVLIGGVYYLNICV